MGNLTRDMVPKQAGLREKENAQKSAQDFNPKRHIFFFTSVILLKQSLPPSSVQCVINLACATRRRYTRRGARKKGEKIGFGWSACVCLFNRHTPSWRGRLLVACLPQISQTEGHQAQPLSNITTYEKREHQQSTRYQTNNAEAPCIFGSGWLVPPPGRNVFGTDFWGASSLLWAPPPSPPQIF